MTIAKPISRTFIVGLLIVVAVLVYAAMSTRLAPAPSIPSFTLHQQTQTETRGSSVNSENQAQAVKSSQSSQPSQTSAVQDSSGSSAPANAAGSTGKGIQRFADGGPDVVGPAAAQNRESCGPKPCPRPQR
jgi:hypothetical protein